jgi:hypothetical protein
MSRIKQLRSSIEKKLDFLEHQALALEAQLTQTKEQALQRLEQRKQLLREVLQRVQADLQKSKDIAAQAKTEVQVKLEQLQVQLALGKADAREKFEEQRTKTLKVLNEFESIADQKLKGVAFESGKVFEDLVGRASALVYMGGAPSTGALRPLRAPFPRENRARSARVRSATFLGEIRASSEGAL